MSKNIFFKLLFILLCYFISTIFAFSYIYPISFFFFLKISNHFLNFYFFSITYIFISNLLLNPRPNYSPLRGWLHWKYFRGINFFSNYHLRKFIQPVLVQLVTIGQFSFHSGGIHGQILNMKQNETQYSGK